MHSVLNNIPSTLAGQMSYIDYIMFASPRRGQHIYYRLSLVVGTLFSWMLVFLSEWFPLNKMYVGDFFFIRQ